MKVTMWKTLNYIWNKERSHRNKRDREVQACWRNLINIRRVDVMEIKNKKKGWILEMLLDYVTNEKIKESQCVMLIAQNFF